MSVELGDDWVKLRETAFLTMAVLIFNAEEQGEVDVFVEESVEVIL